MRRLRAHAFNLCFIAYTIVLGVAGFGVRLFARHLAFDLARLWIRGTVRLLALVGGVRIELAGRDHLPADGIALIASQHRAAIDSLVWFLIVPRPSYVMKRELARIPLVGPLLAPAGMIAVDRQGGATALRSLLAAGRAAASDGRTVVIFPEGTRVARTGDAALQPGVVALGRAIDGPLLPVATDSGAAWGAGFLLRTDAGPHPRTIRIVIGPALPDNAMRADALRAIETGWRDAETAMNAGTTSWMRL